MIDTQTERCRDCRIRAMKVADVVRELAAMTDEERRAALAEYTRQQQARSAAFCREYPDKCED